MCNFNHESRKAVNRFPNPLENVQHALGERAFHPLLKAIHQGRAQKGHDLSNGQPLPSHSLAQGYYMSPQNFQQSLHRMNHSPKRCQWCGIRLPHHLSQQHFRPHDHREHIQHHFHPDCWQARLFAVAIIFGHVQPNQLIPYQRSAKPRRRKRWMVRETVEYIVKKVRTSQQIHPRKPCYGRKW